MTVTMHHPVSPNRLLHLRVEPTSDRRISYRSGGLRKASVWRFDELEPIVMAAIELHQLPEMHPSLPTRPIRIARALPVSRGQRHRVRRSPSPATPVPSGVAERTFVLSSLYDIIEECRHSDHSSQTVWSITKQRSCSRNGTVTGTISARRRWTVERRTSSNSAAAFVILPL